MAEVVEINHIDDLDHYYLFWKSLHDQTPGASFFQSLEWLQAYWRHLGNSGRLRVLVVYSGGSVIGILPLAVVRERSRVGRIRTLTHAAGDWTSFHGPIGPNPTATLVAAMRHLRRGPRDWDILDLRRVNRDGHDRGRTRLAMQTAGFQAHETVWSELPLVELPTTWEAYLASRPNKLCTDVIRAEQRLAELGDVTYERFRPAGTACGDGDPRWDLFEQCVTLSHQNRQPKAAGNASLAHEPLRQFFRETHALAARAGAVDMNLLRINGKLAAHSYNFRREGRLQRIDCGFVPDHQPQELATVLQARSICDSIQRGDRVIELGAREMHVDLPWVTRVARSYRYTHYPLAAPRVQLLRLGHWMNRRLSAAGGKLATSIS